MLIYSDKVCDVNVNLRVLYFAYIKFCDFEKIMKNLVLMKLSENLRYV